MAIVNFIDFYSTVAEALTERTSPQIDFYEVRGIQLLPNNAYPYIQTTNVSGGIELEDWTAVIVNTWDDSETDVTAYFSVTNIFNDTDGFPQFDWSLTNVPYDFGAKMVYLKVDQLIGDTFYSNMFQLTDNKSEKTTRLDYRNTATATMQSIQLKMWFWQYLKNQEVTTYYETSTKNTVSNVIKSQLYERWITESISNSLYLKISNVFEQKFVYVNLTRSNLFDNIEVKEHSGKQNFAQNILKLAFNSTDTYNPLAVSPLPPVPDVPTITLSGVVPDGVNATYTFSYANFVPTYLVFDRSQDQITWTSNTLGVTTPQSVTFNGTGVWYFRISHPEAISNVIMLDLGSAVVAIDDYREILKGATINISVLANDTLVGTTTITGVTVPTNGTATSITGDTEVQYVHNDSVTTSDSFGYTISNGLTSDSATVYLSIITSSFSNGTNVSHGHALPAVDPDSSEITGILTVTTTKTYKVTIKNEFNYLNKSTGYLSIQGIGNLTVDTINNDNSTIESTGTLVVTAGVYAYTLRATLDIKGGATVGACTATIIEI